MIVMILAAGRGERLRPLTDTTPKALVDVNGISLLERHLAALALAEVTDVVINLGWLGAQIMDRVGSGERYGLRVIYSDEGDNVLETGGGVHRALPILGERPFVVMNADILTDIPIASLQIRDNAVAHLVLVDTPTYRSHGDFELEQDRIRNSDVPRYTFSGVGIYRPEFFSDCEAGRFSIVPMLREAADAGTLQGSLHSGVWADVGTPERLAALKTP